MKAAVGDILAWGSFDEEGYYSEYFVMSVVPPVVQSSTGIIYKLAEMKYASPTGGLIESIDDLLGYSHIRLRVTPFQQFIRETLEGNDAKVESGG